jgi:hypothetical protein
VCSSDLIEKPTSVTVFGVLNVVFGVLGLLCSPCIMFGLVMAGEKTEMAFTYKMFLLFMNVIGFGFSIWLIALGIGLFIMKKWARSGSILYGWLGILFFLVETGVNILAMSLGWLKIPQDGLDEYF